MIRWPWVSRKTLVRERVEALNRLDDERRLAHDLALVQVRQARSEYEDVFVASLLPFVEKWTHAQASMHGERVQVTLYVHAQTITDLARDPTMADYLGRTLGGQFAAELRNLRLVEIMRDRTPKDLW